MTFERNIDPKRQIGIGSLGRRNIVIDGEYLVRDRTCDKEDDAKRSYHIRALAYAFTKWNQREKLGEEIS